MIDGIEIVRNPRARSMRLTLDRTTGQARLVLPRRAALKTAIAWAQDKRGWLAEQRASLPKPVPYAPGTVLVVDDAALTIAWAAGRRRAVVREGGLLSLEGPIETLPRRVEAWLRRTALDLLADDTRHYARAAGVTVAQVAVGDARGRWGSCASSGAIRYSWRLVLAPAWVRRATAAHEVAHRVHMNHGAAFHALVAELYGADPAPARVWLRSHGAALHWVGRSS
ncbi:M48 family metallopeptidase [Sphingomonas sp.]|uniref:M48 family metallopeptidase n=1 Tax=Sphingomonas sp. TaxID=28214 RepID=UPI0035BC027A